MIRAPTMRVERPQEVCHTYSRSPASFWNVTSKALPKFCPRSWLVPDWRALPSCIIASMVRVSRAPAKRSWALLIPRTTGIAIISLAKSRYTSSMRCTSSWASAWVAWAVCPSCQKNSPVRRNMRVRSSQRMTLAHWLISRGRSRWESIHLAKKCPMIVSDVGRMQYASSSSLPPACVTTASSGANPSTCSASFSRKLIGISRGKAAFLWPVALKRRSRSRCMASQMAYPWGLMTMQPLTTPAGSARSACWMTSWYHCA